VHRQHLPLIVHNLSFYPNSVRLVLAAERTLRTQFDPVSLVQPRTVLEIDMPPLEHSVSGSSGRPTSSRRQQPELKPEPPRRSIELGGYIVTVRRTE
jgi:hypothetical protein